MEVSCADIDLIVGFTWSIEHTQKIKKIDNHQNSQIIKFTTSSPKKRKKKKKKRVLAPSGLFP